MLPHRLHLHPWLQHQVSAAGRQLMGGLLRPVAYAATRVIEPRDEDPVAMTKVCHPPSLFLP